MSKFTAIILSLVVTLQSASISIADVFNIDELIEHAQEHRTEFGDNFFQFLAKHYGNQKAQHSSHHEHQSSHDNLPFQQSLHVSLVFVLDADTLFNLKLKDIPIERSASNFHYNAPSSNSYISGIFQPPRLA